MTDLVAKFYSLDLAKRMDDRTAQCVSDPDRVPGERRGALCPPRLRRWTIPSSHGPQEEWWVFSGNGYTIVRKSILPPVSEDEIIGSLPEPDV